VSKQCSNSGSSETNLINSTANIARIVASIILSLWSTKSRNFPWLIVSGVIARQSNGTKQRPRPSLQRTESPRMIWMNVQSSNVKSWIVLHALRLFRHETIKSRLAWENERNVVGRLMDVRGGWVETKYSIWSGRERGRTFGSGSRFPETLS